MIYCSNFGTMGRLGNQVMRLMSIIGFAKKYGCDYELPAWKYSKYFKGQFSFEERNRFDLSIGEPEFHYTPEFWDKIPWQDKVVNINGWFQSWKYWTDAEKQIQETIAFEETFINSLGDRYSKVFEKPVIAISIRRGDFVGNPNYYQLPVLYYILALFEHFPDWRNQNLLFFSDDISYCKLHFQCLDNAFFAEGDDIDQLALMTLCDNYIVSNSTFSYCGAWLSQNKNAKVIRPKYNFAGPLAEKKSEKDYWPGHWTVFEHEGKKLDLRDVTFTIPVLYDHRDRKHNLDLSVCMLQKDLDTTVIVGEQGGHRMQYMEQYCKYHAFDMEQFHRTKMLNDMANMSETPIIVNYDADVIIPPLQLYEAARLIREGQADMVYPFDGRFARVPRERNFQVLERSLDLGSFCKNFFKNQDKYDSVGGCILYNKESFVHGGMENENMISFGPEDHERYERFQRLGFAVKKVKGVLYHIDHFKGLNSTTAQPFFSTNHKELDKIRAMSNAQLSRYVQSWEWVNKYIASYYETITENAVTSCRQMFDHLVEFGVKPKSVIDIGCGLGEWGVPLIEQGIQYVGIDLKIPRHKLLIPRENYFEYDLTSGTPFPITEKFDLALCLEVLEHIPETFSRQAVDLICSLSDTILFSAAIPHQGGHHHVNEQWQSWWSELFSQNDFRPMIIREKIFNNENIDIWYRNNAVIYKRWAWEGAPYPAVTDYVHPKLFQNIVGHLQAMSKS